MERKGGVKKKVCIHRPIRVLREDSEQAAQKARDPAVTSVVCALRGEQKRCSQSIYTRASRVDRFAVSMHQVGILPLSVFPSHSISVLGPPLHFCFLSFFFFFSH